MLAGPRRIPGKTAAEAANFATFMDWIKRADGRAAIGRRESFARVSDECASSGNGANDGDRTHDHSDHNRELYH